MKLFLDTSKLCLKRSFEKKYFILLPEIVRSTNVRKFLIRKTDEKKKKIISSNRTRRWIYDVIYDILIFHSFTRRIAAFRSPRKNARRDAFFTAVHTARNAYALRTQEIVNKDASLFNRSPISDTNISSCKLSFHDFYLRTFVTRFLFFFFFQFLNNFERFLDRLLHENE